MVSVFSDDHRGGRNRALKVAVLMVEFSIGHRFRETKGGCCSPSDKDSGYGVSFSKRCTWRSEIELKVSAMEVLERERTRIERNDGGGGTVVVWAVSWWSRGGAW